MMGNMNHQDAVVWFANSARGLRLARLVLPEVLPGTHRSLEWLHIGDTLDGKQAVPFLLMYID
jgi:hypothetical protein